MPKILVVDDESVLAETMLLMLKSSGYKAVSARNGQQATDLIKQNMPDLVISDLVMPVLDGLKLLEWLRDHRSMDHIKFIMMTGKENVLEPLKRYMVEADEYLAKPFSEQQLMEKVKQMIGPPEAGD